MGLNVYKYYRTAPPAGKIAIIGGHIAVGIIAYAAVRSVIKHLQHQKELKGQRQAVDDSKDVVRVLQQQGQGPSFPDAQYSTWASAIQTAFDGCDPNSDDMGAVMNAVNPMRNEADVYKLISTFGVRKWDECGWWTGDVERDLAGGIRNELNQNQIGLVNQVLREKGISYQF